MPLAAWFTLALLSSVALALVVYALLILLLGRRLPDPLQWDTPGHTKSERTDARYRKLGFYMNPQDTHLFVPKPGGWTVNIGHPKGRLTAAGILLLVALMIVLIEAVPLLLLRW